MHRIHQALVSGTYPNATRLAAEIEVSAKSIHRDIEFMRDRLALPIAFNGRRNGYYYTEEVSAFPAVQLSEGELLALMIAEKALHQYRGTSFEKPLLSAIRKLESSLPETVSFNLAEWDQSISFRTSAEAVVDLEVFERLTRATTRREQLELQYRKPGCKDAETRVVDPYHLANINGEWFLFGYCHLRRDIRTFVPGRILSIRATGPTFTRPDKFSLERRLRDSFGVRSGDTRYEVVIRFQERLADYIREKKWHQSQSVRELSDGGVELHMELSSLAEVQRWVLGWGGGAVVLAPAELAASVQRAAREILVGAGAAAEPSPRG